MPQQHLAPFFSFYFIRMPCCFLIHLRLKKESFNHFVDHIFVAFDMKIKGSREAEGALPGKMPLPMFVLFRNVFTSGAVVCDKVLFMRVSRPPIYHL